MDLAPDGDGPRPRLSPVAAAAVGGAVWGAAGYAVLWGKTPLTVTHRFVTSTAGTALLLPVRTVLWMIRALEVHVAHRSFDFADRNAWIGVVAAILGGAYAAVVAVGTRAFLRRRRRARLPA